MNKGSSRGKHFMLAKIIAITVCTVYGGHRLVKYVTPTEEELLAVSFKLCKECFNDFLIEISRGKEK